MSGTSRASLGGVPTASDAAVRWTQVRGAAPSQTVLLFHEDEWKRVRRLFGQEVTLKIERYNGKAREIERLTPLREVPAGKPMHRAVLVADRRWRWPYKLVVRDYNVTRRTGDRYLVGNVPVELQESAPDYTYTRWSKKKDGTPWPALDVILDVLEEITKREVEARPDEGSGIIVDGIGVKEQEEAVKVENLTLADPGDAAVRRVLQLIPTADVTVDDRGYIRVFNSVDSAATMDVLGALGNPTALGGVLRRISLAAVRPRGVIVYFERELEVRLDSKEEADNEGTVAPSDAEDFLMLNCAPSPDVSLTIGGKQVGMGSIVDLENLLPKWNEDISSVEATTPLTFANLRRLWFVLDGYYSPIGALTLNAAEQNWAARIGTLKGHYRQTFRVPAWLRDAVKEWQGKRTGVVDPINKIRTPAMAWGEYAIEPSTKFRLATRNRPDKQYHWINVEGYPGVDGELSDQAASPCVVDVVDPQVGILHLNYRTDPYGMRAQIVPSCLRLDGGSGDLVAPTRDLTDPSGVFGLQWRTTSTSPVGLSARWGVAVVLTALPGSPNGKERLHRIDIEPKDLQESFVEDFTVAGGEGPWLEVYVPPSIMTAWYAWTSTGEARETAKRLLGLDDAGVGGEPAGYTVLNAQYLLPAVAKAMAAVHMAQWVDAIEGDQADTLNPAARVAGHIEAVTTALAPDGRVATTVALPAARRALSFLAMVPPELRTAILGTLPPGRG